LVAGFLAVAFLCLLLGLFIFTRGSSETLALVQDVEWTYEIEIQEFGPVTDENWRDKVPSGAQLGSCRPKARGVQDEPAPNATEVCGTPYVEDTGTGQGKVVQDCEYHVYEDWCEYTVDEWRSVGKETANGRDLNPTWPALNLRPNQREGERLEEYKVVFDDDGKTYVFHPSDLQGFRRFAVGSRWKVETNVLGGVTSVEPAD
jgi:hypothetical protein